MNPQDIVILFKIFSLEAEKWNQLTLADTLFMSQSEISQSLVRSKYSGLLSQDGKSVFRLAFFDFIRYGLQYVFPQKPGPVVRGVLTAHSAPPLNAEINSEENYAWPSHKGNARGQSIKPLYPSVVDAVKLDKKLYEYLALADAIRVGRIRERNQAINKLENRILHEKPES